MKNLFQQVVLTVIVPLSVFGYIHNFDQNQARLEQSAKQNPNYVGYIQIGTVKTFYFSNTAK